MFVVGGESLIDLIAEPVAADGVLRLAAHQGGSPYNCAIALARLGNDTGFLCPISSDGLGTHLLAPLVEAGVQTLLSERVAAYTSLAVVTFDAKRSAQYGFYRNADRAFTRDGLIAALPPALDVFQIGGFCSIEPEDAEAWLAVAAEAAKRGATLSMDPDVRPSLVPDFVGYRARLERFLDLVHLVKLSVEDLMALEKGEAVKGLPRAEQDAIVDKYVADFLARPHCELVVVTFGDAGSRAYSRSGRATRPVFPAVPFGDTVGAGDSLMAGILTHLSETGALQPGRLGALDDAALDRMLAFGAVVAGLNCREVGCVPPTRSQVDGALAGA